MSSYHNLKRIIYILQTAIGIYFMFMAYTIGAGFHPHDVTDVVVGVTLAFIGLGLTVFGILTYLLRADEDIWR